MKKVSLLWIVTFFFAYVINAGCTLSGGDIILPDISSFSIQRISTFTPGDSASVTIFSSSLTAGPYLVHYNLSGANVSSGITAVLNMNNDTGSFSTPLLPNAGNTTLTFSEITTSSGGNAWIYNTKTFTDSIGLMTATINDTGSYKALHVTATLSGNLLTIKGTYWSPLTMITLNIDDYTQMTGPVYFNAGNITNTNCSATYSIPAKIDSAQHGVVTILSTAPLLTGTFSFTNKDSSTISNGTFSCSAP